MPSITCSKCGGRIWYDTTENLSHPDRAKVQCSDTKACAKRAEDEQTARDKGVRRSPRGFVEQRERGVYEKTPAGLLRVVPGKTKDVVTVG